MTQSRRKAFGDLVTKPADTDVDSAADEPNTAVMDVDPLRKAAAADPDESTAVVRNPLAGDSAPSAQPRGGTAPYPTIDARAAAESVRQAAAAPSSESRLEDAPTLSEASGPSQAIAPGSEPEVEVASALPSTGTTLPGSGPSAGPSTTPASPSAPSSPSSPSSVSSPTARKDVPIAPSQGPRIVTLGESTHPTPRSPSREGSKRVVSVTGAFVGATLAIALVAGAALIGGAILVSRDRSSTQAPTAQTPAPQVTPNGPATGVAAPATSATTTTTAATATATSGASTGAAATPKDAAASGSAGAAGSAEPLLPKESGPKPSKLALDRMTASLRAPLEACAHGLPKAFYAIHLELDGATGKPLNVDAVKPLHGTVAGACAMRAGLDARVPPFAGKSFALDVKFAP